MDIQRLIDAIGDRSIAVVIPCYNAGLSIASVVIGFQKALPSADIIVFDNGSDDNSAHMARAAGARIVHEPRRGRTNVITRIFSDTDADLIVMAAGDGAHDPAQAPMLIAELIGSGSDMAVGVCQNTKNGGNACNRLFQVLFGPTFNDIFSGYRVFTRRFVKSFPAATIGCDIEAELSAHACELRIPTCEAPVTYDWRGGGASGRPSARDGLHILWAFAALFREMRPLAFHAVIAALIAGAGLALAAFVVAEFLQTGHVSGLATAIGSTGLMLAALIVGGCGIVLDSLKRFRIEQKRLTYLSYPGFGAAAKPVDIPSSNNRRAASQHGPTDARYNLDFPRSSNAA